MVRVGDECPGRDRVADEYPSRVGVGNGQVGSG